MCLFVLFWFLLCFLFFCFFFILTRETFKIGRIKKIIFYYSEHVYPLGYIFIICLITRMHDNFRQFPFDDYSRRKSKTLIYFLDVFIIRETNSTTIGLWYFSSFDCKIVKFKYLEKGRNPQFIFKDYESHWERSERLQLRVCMLNQNSMHLKIGTSNLVCSLSPHCRLILQILPTTFFNHLNENVYGKQPNTIQSGVLRRQSHFNNSDLCLDMT